MAVAVACIAPLLQSRSGDAVAVSVAVPLPLMLSAIRAEDRWSVWGASSAGLARTPASEHTSGT